MCDLGVSRRPLRSQPIDVPIGQWRRSPHQKTWQRRSAHAGSVGFQFQTCEASPRYCRAAYRPVASEVGHSPAAIHPCRFGGTGRARRMGKK